MSFLLLIIIPELSILAQVLNQIEDHNAIYKKKLVNHNNEFNFWEESRNDNTEQSHKADPISEFI